jgi:hypothetical protein
MWNMPCGLEFAQFLASIFGIFEKIAPFCQFVSASDLP